MPCTTCAHHGMRKASTDTSRVPACRYDLNDQPDEGQVGAVFESVPKLTRTPRGLVVLYVRATRTAPPAACCTYQRRLTLYVVRGTRTSLGRAACTAYRGYHPRSVRLADATLIVKLQRSYGQRSEVQQPGHMYVGPRGRLRHRCRSRHRPIHRKLAACSMADRADSPCFSPPPPPARSQLHG